MLRIDSLLKSSRKIYSREEQTNQNIILFDSYNDSFSVVSCQENFTDIINTASDRYYKNKYSTEGNLVSKYEYNENNQIISRQDYDSEGFVVKKTFYVNGKETKTLQFNTTGQYDSVDIIADCIINEVVQNQTPDCWLIQGLMNISQTEQGRNAIHRAIQLDYPNKGDYTITFKKGYGEKTSFTITQKELERAKNEKLRIFNLRLEDGSKLFVDGKKELTSKGLSIQHLDLSDINNNITVIDINGKVTVYDKDALLKLSETKDDRFDVGLKYSTGDIDTLAFELAMEKNLKEAGLTLNTGFFEELLVALFNNGISNEFIYNLSLKPKESAIKDSCDTESKTENLPVLETVTDKKRQKKISKYIKKECGYLFKNFAFEEKDAIISRLKKFQKNQNNYINYVSLAIDDSGNNHAGLIKRIETVDGEDYVVYTHAWNMDAEVYEEINYFVENTLARMSFVTIDNMQKVNTLNIDGKIGEFSSSSKRNISNIIAAINLVTISKENKNLVNKDVNGNIKVNIAGSEVSISISELEYAIASGKYSSGDDDVIAIELALERFINHKKHNNDLRNLNNTNLADITPDELIKLLLDKDLSSTFTTISNDICNNNPKIIYLERTQQFYAIKSIEKMSDGKYCLNIVPPEDSSVEIMYTEDELLSLMPYTIYMYK